MSDDLARQVCNRAASDGLKALCGPIIDANLDGVQLMIALESLIVGALMMNVKLGGDEIVIDALADRLRERMAEQRFVEVEPAGRA